MMSVVVAWRMSRTIISAVSLLGVDEVVDAEGGARDRAVLLHQLRVAHAGNRGFDPGVLGDEAGNEVNLVVVRHGGHEVTLGNSGVVEGADAGAVPLDDDRVHLLAGALRPGGIGLDDGDVGSLPEQTPAELEPDVTRTNNQDTHVRRVLQEGGEVHHVGGEGAQPDEHRDGAVTAQRLG